MPREASPAFSCRRPGGHLTALGTMLFLLLATAGDLPRSALAEVQPPSSPPSAASPEQRATAGEGQAAAQRQPRVIVLIEGAQRTRSAELEPIQAGLAAMLLSDLAAHPELRVVSRERVAAAFAEAQLGEAALAEPQTAQKLGRAVQADTPLALSLTGSPVRFTATLQLLSPQTGEPQWSRDFKGEGSGLPALASQMAAALRQQLGLPEAKAGQPQQGQRATLAIFDFEPGGPAAELDKYRGDLADLLATCLSEKSGVQLVERQRLTTLLEEQAIKCFSIARRRMDAVHADSCAQTTGNAPGPCE